MQRLLPPHLFLIALVLVVGLGLGAPVVGPLPWLARIAGLALAVLGLALTTRNARRFATLGTNIKTFDDPDQFVRDGAFAYTRNPMYVGFAVALVGAALAVGTLSAWVGPVAFLVAADRWYIPFEERRLVSLFGADYERYRSEVPRWIGAQRWLGVQR